MCGDITSLNSPQDIARYVAYLLKLQKSGNISFKNIQAKKLYSDNKNLFDKFFNLADKYEINKEKYVRFFVLFLHKGKSDIKTDFLCMNTLNKYVNYLQIQFQYEKIYSNVLKSVDNIVDECLKMGYSDAKDYLKWLIRENKLAEKVFSGKISQYYLVTIKDIDKIIAGMDSISRDELNVIVERKTKLRADTQNAFLSIKSQQMSPIRLTNQKLNEKINKKNKLEKKYGE